MSHSVSESGIVAQAVKGSHVLKIDGYSRIMGLGDDRFVASDPFDVGGYAWVIRYYPDGQTTMNSGWISVFLRLNNSPGGTDAQASFAFSLLNRDGVPSNRFEEDKVRTFSSWRYRFDLPAWGCAEFIQRKTLEESQVYLKDDSFRIRCDVTVWKAVRTGCIPRAVTVPPSDMDLESQVGTDVTGENQTNNDNLESTSTSY